MRLRICCDHRGAAALKGHDYAWVQEIEQVVVEAITSRVYPGKAFGSWVSHGVSVRTLQTRNWKKLTKV